MSMKGREFPFRIVKPLTNFSPFNAAMSARKAATMGLDTSPPMMRISSFAPCSILPSLANSIRLRTFRAGREHPPMTFVTPESR